MYTAKTTLGKHSGVGLKGNPQKSAAVVLKFVRGKLAVKNLSVDQLLQNNFSIVLTCNY